MSKTAVVLGGGGAKGAYQIGVFKALKKLGIHYDIITGSSVGSINGAIIAQGDYTCAKKMWQSISTNNILDLKSEIDESSPDTHKQLIKELIGNNGCDYNNLKTLLAKHIDEKKLRNSPVDFGLVTVKYPSMTPLYIFKEEMEEGKIADYILGSSAFFPAMKPHKIDGDMYIDGGYNDNIPINMAIERGADTIIAVDLKSVGLVKKPKDKNIKIIRIDSYSDLGDLLVFDTKRSKINIKLGYYDTLKAFGKYEGYKYTFYKDELNRNYKKLYHLPESILTSENEKFINRLKKIIANNLKPKFKDSTYSEQEYFNMIFENTLELFKVPYLEVYKVKKANFLLKKIYASIDSTGISDLIKSDSKQNIFKKTKDIKNILKDIDRLTLIKHITENIEKYINENPILLYLIAITIPVEFASAVYIYLLIK